VKISGYRIELGEIDAVLEEHPSVAQAAVCATVGTGDGSGRQLVAYVRLRAPVDHAIAMLRTHLTQKLPGYMVPSSFMKVAAFPVTPNGKVDRQALLAMGVGYTFDPVDHVPARTQLEATLCAMWQQALGIETLGVKDNFFDLGASSLHGAHLLAAMERRFGRQLPLGALFQAPTVERFAAMIEGAPPPRRCTSLVAVQPHGTRMPIFCVHGGAGTIYLFHALARRLGADQPVYAFQSQGLYGDRAPHRRVEEMAAHYVAEMQGVQPHGPYLMGGYCFGGIVAYEMAQQLTRMGERVALLALFNAPTSEYTLAQRGGWRSIVPSSWRTDEAPRTFAGAFMLRLKWLYWLSASRKRAAVRWLGWRTALARGVPLSDDLRDYFFLLNNLKAERAYTPTPYEGDMVIFREEHERDSTLGWGTLVRGGVQVHAIEGDNRSRLIMQEPEVGEVAVRLQDHLPHHGRAAITTRAAS
jgi:thioesterase domain-containing protein/acyl carrier protein